MRGPLAAALAGLAAGDRDVLLLIAWEQLTYDETAQALGIPIGTVRSRLNRARGVLRAALASAGRPEHSRRSSAMSDIDMVTGLRPEIPLHSLDSLAPARGRLLAAIAAERAAGPGPLAPAGTNNPGPRVRRLPVRRLALPASAWPSRPRPRWSRPRAARDRPLWSRRST